MCLDLGDEDHLAGVLDAEIDRLAGRLHQLVHHHTPDAGEPPVSQEGSADLESTDADQPKAAFFVVEDEFMCLQARQDAVGSRGRQAGALGEVGEGQAVRGGDNGEHGKASVDGLNRTGALGHQL